MAVTNRKLLQLAGSTLAKIKALTGDDSIQPRELLVATDTGNLVVGKADGTQVVIGSVVSGTTAERTAATPEKGMFFFDTTEGNLYIGTGSAWQISIAALDTSNFIEKVEDAVENNIAVLAADGSVADSGVKIDDSGSDDKVIWSAAKVTEAITDAINGMSWQKPVKSVVSELPATPTKGDRHLVIAETGEQKDKIVEYNGTAWVATNPIDGMAVFVEDTDQQFAYNGTEWVNISAGFTYAQGNGINLVNNTFSVKAKENGGIVVAAEGVSVNVDGTTIVLNDTGKIEFGTLDLGEF